MKKAIVIFVASVALTALVMTPSTGCKKEKCYHCELNPGQSTNQGTWDVCGEEDHDRAVSMGYVCTEK